MAFPYAWFEFMDCIVLTTNPLFAEEGLSGDLNLIDIFSSFDLGLQLWSYLWSRTEIRREAAFTVQPSSDGE